MSHWSEYWHIVGSSCRGSILRLLSPWIPKSVTNQIYRSPHLVSSKCDCSCTLVRFAGPSKSLLREVWSSGDLLRPLEGRKWTIPGFGHVWPPQLAEEQEELAEEPPWLESCFHCIWRSACEENCGFRTCSEVTLWWHNSQINTALPVHS